MRDADVILQRKIRLRIPDSLRGKRVFAFAGLADNGQFFKSLGLDLIGTRSFPDHHRYTAGEIEAIKHEAGNAEAIVTTEKDAVKIADRDIVAIPLDFVIDDFTKILGVVDK